MRSTPFWTDQRPNEHKQLYVRVCCQIRPFPSLAFEGASAGLEGLVDNDIFLRHSRRAKFFLPHTMVARTSAKKIETSPT